MASFAMLRKTVPDSRKLLSAPPPLAVPAGGHSGCVEKTSCLNAPARRKHIRARYSSTAGASATTISGSNEPLPLDELVRGRAGGGAELAQEMQRVVAGDGCQIRQGCARGGMHRRRRAGRMAEGIAIDEMQPKHPAECDGDPPGPRTHPRGEPAPAPLRSRHARTDRTSRIERPLVSQMPAHYHI